MYWAPWSKVTSESTRRVEMRPPKPPLFSNTVGEKPDFLRNWAQVRAAMPAPTIAIRGEEGGVVVMESARHLVCHCIAYVNKSKPDDDLKRLHAMLRRDVLDHP